MCVENEVRSEIKLRKCLLTRLYVALRCTQQPLLVTLPLAQLGLALRRQEAQHGVSRLRSTAERRGCGTGYCGPRSDRSHWSLRLETVCAFLILVWPRNALRIGEDDRLGRITAGDADLTAEVLRSGVECSPSSTHGTGNAISSCKTPHDDGHRTHFLANLKFQS